MLSNMPKVTQRKHGTVKHFTPVFTFQEIILELLIAGVGIVALRHCQVPFLLDLRSHCAALLRGH